METSLDMSILISLLVLIGLFASASVGFIVGRLTASTPEEKFYDEE